MYVGSTSLIVAAASEYVPPENMYVLETYAIICLYIYVCMYVCMYIYIYIYAHTADTHTHTEA
jgi:hypothetical protein